MHPPLQVPNYIVINVLSSSETSESKQRRISVWQSARRSEEFKSQVDWKCDPTMIHTMWQAESRGVRGRGDGRDDDM
ncbi:hypothetical protein E4U56_000502 [Claviceps arundinis]|uniref:Uncharacterized protein n=1 Tax=Claviceps arundinis TaxID=1623583 RepID=A0A9P7SRS3_9HYPO|nr:hypothetical protein E4U56_000502 [Claviceps arundinis]